MTFLKQFARLPCIAWEDMKTISKRATGHAGFVKTQLLPELTPKMMIRRGEPAVFPLVWQDNRSAWASRHAKHPSATHRLSLPQASESRAERAVFALLAVGATVCLGQALATITELPPNWPMLSASVARSLG
jgi:hypothetical protein